MQFFRDLEQFCMRDKSLNGFSMFSKSYSRSEKISLRLFLVLYRNLTWWKKRIR